MSTQIETKRTSDPAVTKVTTRSVTPRMFFTVAAIVAVAVVLVGIFMSVTNDQPAPGSTGFDRSEELVEKIQRQQILQKERSS